MKNILFSEIDFIITDEDTKFLDSLLKEVKEDNVFLDTYGNNIAVRQDEVFFQKFIRDLKTDYRKTEFFKKLYKLFDPLGIDVYKKSQIVKITGSLVPHVDTRSCVFTIPLNDVVAPITWYNQDNSVLYRYYYKNPVLINTHVKHGCVENNMDRYLFQVGIDCDFGDFSKINNLIAGTS